MLSTVERVGSFLGPILGAFLLTTFVIETVLGIDAISFVFAAPLVIWSLQGVSFKTLAMKLGLKAYWNRSLEGIKLITKKGDLTLLLILSLITNLAFSLAFVFLFPFLLEFGFSENWIAYVLSTGAIVQILTNISLFKLRQPKDTLMSELRGTVALSFFAFFIGALAFNSYWVVASYILAMFILPPLNVWNRTSWHLRTPEYEQGRVFATRRALGGALGALGFVIVGPPVNPLIDFLKTHAGVDAINAYRSMYGFCFLLLFFVSMFGIFKCRKKSGALE